MATGQGWFGNHRTLKEQLLGLAPALAEAKGETILDAGCAEGLIAIEFFKARARLIHAFDNNLEYVSTAQGNAWRNARHVMKAGFGDLNLGIPEWCRPPYDIVLALAVIHKAADVEQATRALAEACSGLMVIRLPYGSQGLFKAKFGLSVCDLRDEMPRLGFTLERKEPGPRGECVMYWRRT